MRATDKVTEAVVQVWAREILAEWLSGHQAIDDRDDQRYRVAVVGSAGVSDLYRVSVDGVEHPRRFWVTVTVAAIIDGEP